ncbi:zinc finger protein 830-like, partial [Calliphora vicina]|uniref:zinc finger protein 830-like n=1 Tax=Calliphora vicina TaxID=7373 RepID=UPI00325BB972
FGFINIDFTYDSKGNLICIICKNIIKSVAIWKVHIHSKLHKSNLEEAKKFNVKKQILDKSLKKKISHVIGLQTSLNSRKLSKENISTGMKLTHNQNIGTSIIQESSDLLPEMFFDDPIVDAKIRHVEYKNVQDDEWERFQREIKEESMASNELISGEQINSAVEREITEISEQIHQWSKVIDLENKLHKIVKIEKQNEHVETDEEISDDEFINENLDWRSKNFF